MNTLLGLFNVCAFFYRLEVNVALAVLLKLSNLMLFPFSSK